jgi:hypothetical protein
VVRPRDEPRKIWKRSERQKIEAVELVLEESFSVRAAGAAKAVLYQIVCIDMLRKMNHIQKETLKCSILSRMCCGS